MKSLEYFINEQKSKSPYVQDKENAEFLEKEKEKQDEKEKKGSDKED